MLMFSLATWVAQEEGVSSDLEAWLSFVSSTLWQLLAIGFVLVFRQQFAELLGRLSRFKIGSLEGELEQISDPDAPAPLAAPLVSEAAEETEEAEGTAPLPVVPSLGPGELGGSGKSTLLGGLAASTAQSSIQPAPAVDVIDLVAPGGFLTEKGLDHLLATSGMLGGGEEVTGHLLLLRTKKQRTWLVATDRSLYCLLDDENTRAKGRVIQWTQPLSAVDETLVRTKSRSEFSGLVDVGTRRNWLYSHSLHPDPRQLESRIRQLGRSS